MIKSPVSTKVQPSPERLAVQMKFMERRYDDVLTKVLEQNALILNSVARMQDDLKTLRTKVESLELSAAQEETKVNGVESRSSGNESNNNTSQQNVTGGQTLPGTASPFGQQQQQQPVPFYNPYAPPMYNPYMMMQMADPLNYLMNPAATMQYAALYGALNQNAAANAAAAAVTPEPPKTLPPFSFGVQLPTPTAPTDTAASISFAPPKVAEAKKTENGIALVTQASKLETAPAPAPVTPPTKPAVKPAVVPATPQKTTTAAPATATVVQRSTPTTAAVSSVSTSSIFGTTTPSFATPGSKGSLFGTPSSTNATYGTSAGSGGLSFGTPNSGGVTPSSNAPIFGTPSSTTSSIFAPATTISSVSKPTFTFGMTTGQQDKVDGPIFSLTPKPAATTTPAAAKGTPEVMKDEKPGAPDFSELAAKASMCSFGEISKTTKANENPFGGFLGFGSSTTVTPVFGSVSSSNISIASSEKTLKSPAAVRDDDVAVDEFVPTQEFEPVIPLPPLVEVKKGDENENVLYQHRSKLLRFVSELKEWKERGIGDLKILQSKDNPKKIRVVMWRERVHKIACNHWVTKEISVSNYQGNPKALMWTAIDFAEADEGPKTEIFVARFGQEDAAKEFKKQMEYAVSLVDQTPVTPQKGEAPGMKEAEKPKEAAPASNVPLSLMFKKPEGTWSCQACYTDNKKESVVCAACTTPNPNAPQVPKTEAPAEAPKFTFGFGLSTTPAAVTPPASKPEEKAKEPTTFTLKSASTPAPLFGSPITSTTPSSTTGSLFGDLGKDKKDPSSSPAPFLDFSKLSSTMPSFGNLAAANTGTTVKPFSGGLGFGSGQVQQVFGASTTTALADSSSKSLTKDGEHEPEEEFVPTAEFKPVIPLPPLVEVKKGDEDENILFQHRAKLLRFMKDLREWKERGVGEIKLLQNKQNPKKIRVVMWREQVHKIACNHWIAKDMEISNYQGNPKALMWTAVDFAEADEGPKTEIFVCRFGQEDKATEFKKEFQKCVELVKNAPDTPEKPNEAAAAAPKQPTTTTQKPLSELFKKAEGEWNCDACYCTNNSDRTTCISCSSAKPGGAAVTTSSTPGEGKNSSDLIAKAESLQLPSNYFSQLKDKPDHPPCRGCEPDSFDFSLLDGRKVPSFEDIPKPQRQSPQQNETLKSLLTQGSDKTPSSSGSSAETPKSALSSFSFSLPSSTTSTTTSTSTPQEFKISTPTFSFTPNFSLTTNKTSVIGSGSVFGSGSGGADSNVPTTVASYGDNVDENGEEDEEDEEDEDPMFLCEGRAYFKEDGGEYQDYGDGTVKILYDGDHFCGRFIFISDTDEDYYVDHIIAAETNVKPAGENTFEWGCVYYSGDSSARSMVKIQFPDQQTYDQFSTAMADSVDIAMQAGVTEDDLINGSAGGSQD